MELQVSDKTLGSVSLNDNVARCRRQRFASSQKMRLQQQQQITSKQQRAMTSNNYHQATASCDQRQLKCKHNCHEQQIMANERRLEASQEVANLHYMTHKRGRGRRRCKLMIGRLIKWPLANLCLPLCLLFLFQPLLLLELVPQSSAATSISQHVGAQSRSESRPHNAQLAEQMPPAATTRVQMGRQDERVSKQAPRITQLHEDRKKGTSRARRSPTTAGGVTLARPAESKGGARSLLMPINELRVSGSKLEPPSRPSVDWSKQRPYFGAPIERNVSVELGKTAHLTCKVFELGDKTVSWLRPRQNEILTAGKFTYIGDSRISSMNENGSNDWILEIKDVGLNDGTSYECQVSTDPKMSMIINLHVLAARARIKQGENNYYPLGANIEFICETLQPNGASLSHRVASSLGATPNSPAQIYWYHNGNLINYARSAGAELARPNTNYTIDFEPGSQTSRLKLRNIQQSDAGNYTCKPTAAEPATVRLFVKKHRANSNTNRVHYSGGSYYVPNSKEAQRGAGRQQQQHYGLDASNAFELADSAANNSNFATANQVGLWLALQLALACSLVTSTYYLTSPHT